MDASNGLLYDGSPLKMPSRELYVAALGEGKAVMKGKAIATYESPSPDSKLISHSSSSITALGDLAKANDIKGLLQKLNKPNLTAVESVVKLLADHIDNVQVGQEILKIGTSPLVLSFECLKQVESSISPFYKQEIRQLSEPLLKAFGKVIKTFQRSQPDPFISKATGEDHKVCSKVDIGTFGAALFHFVKHHSLYSEGSIVYNAETAKGLASPLLQSYSKIMESYVKSLPDHNSSMIDGVTNPLSVKEWYSFYMARTKRDHKGGHCASWRDGYPDDAERLTHVKYLFSKMMEVQMPELNAFPILKQCVVPCMDTYIAKKQANQARKRSAEEMSSDESDAIFLEWRGSR